MRQGDHLTLSAIHSTVHLGAHADGPNHYATDGQAIGARPLELYYGPCQVVSVVIGQGERITPDRISHELTESRVLFKTNTYPDPNHFNEDFAALSPELIDFLTARGVRLVGIDTPSIDLFDDKELITHQAVYRNDVAILEGLVLAGVDDGRYKLIALPLSLADADASPVRAVLETL
jgi:arylformamidase